MIEKKNYKSKQNVALQFCPLLKVLDVSKSFDPFVVKIKKLNIIYLNHEKNSVFNLRRIHHRNR